MRGKGVGSSLGCRPPLAEPWSRDVGGSISQGRLRHTSPEVRTRPTSPPRTPVGAQPPPPFNPTGARPLGVARHRSLGRGPDLVHEGRRLLGESSLIYFSERPREGSHTFHAFRGPFPRGPRVYPVSVGLSLSSSAHCLEERAPSMIRTLRSEQDVRPRLAVSEEARSPGLKERSTLLVSYNTPVLFFFSSVEV